MISWWMLQPIAEGSLLSSLFPREIHWAIMLFLSSQCEQGGPGGGLELHRPAYGVRANGDSQQPLVSHRCQQRVQGRDPCKCLHLDIHVEDVLLICKAYWLQKSTSCIFSALLWVMKHLFLDVIWCVRDRRREREAVVLIELLHVNSSLMQFSCVVYLVD